jgi:hypothetical protein
MEERGGRAVTVVPAYTSQPCAVLEARSRKSQAILCCMAGGPRDHADVKRQKTSGGFGTECLCPRRDRVGGFGKRERAK